MQILPKNGVRCARRAPRNPFQKGSSFVFHIHTVTIQKNKTQKAAGQLAAWQPRMKTYSCGAAIAALQLAALQPRQTTSCVRAFFVPGFAGSTRASRLEARSSSNLFGLRGRSHTLQTGGVGVSSVTTEGSPGAATDGHARRPCKSVMMMSAAGSDAHVELHRPCNSLSTARSSWQRTP